MGIFLCESSVGFGKMFELAKTPLLVFKINKSFCLEKRCVL